MARSYHFYYVGDHIMTEPDEGGREPLPITFSRLEIDEKNSAEMHMHAYLEIFYFERGCGFLECEGGKIAVKPHDFFVVNARRLHQVTVAHAEEPLLYYNLTMDRLHLNGLPYNSLSERPFEHYAFGDENNDVYRMLCSIQRELEERQSRYISKVKHLFRALTVDILRLFSAAESPLQYGGKQRSNHQQLAQVRSYMEGHYAEDLSLERLSQVAMMQKSYFLQQFKRMYGVSPVRYLNLLRIEIAKMLLTGSDKNITEIAAEVGFNHPAYFSEMFVKTVGLTPTGYRRIITEQEELHPGTLRLAEDKRNGQKGKKENETDGQKGKKENETDGLRV